MGLLSEAPAEPLKDDRVRPLADQEEAAVRRPHHHAHALPRGIEFTDVQQLKHPGLGFALHVHEREQGSLFPKPGSRYTRLMQTLAEPGSFADPPFVIGKVSRLKNGNQPGFFLAPNGGSTPTRDVWEPLGVGWGVVDPLPTWRGGVGSDHPLETSKRPKKLKTRTSKLGGAWKSFGSVAGQRAGYKAEIVGKSIKGHFQSSKKNQFVTFSPGKPANHYAPLHAGILVHLRAPGHAITDRPPPPGRGGSLSTYKKPANPFSKSNFLPPKATWPKRKTLAHNQLIINGF